MTWYGMIAYKEDGADYCRGCLMDSWSGQLETCYTEDLEELTSTYGPLALRKYDDREPRFIFTFLINGRPFDHSWSPDSENPGELELRAALYEAADRQVELNKQAAIAAAQREKERQKQYEIEAAAARERQERADYERLQAKYGVKNG